MNSKKISDNINSKRISENMKSKCSQKRWRNIQWKNIENLKAFKIVFKLYILANMADIFPILFDIQISRFQSFFKLNIGSFRSGHFFSSGRTTVSQSNWKNGSCHFFFFLKGFKKIRKFGSALFLSLTLNLLLHPSHVLIVRKVGGRA